MTIDRHALESQLENLRGIAQRRESHEALRELDAARERFQARTFRLVVLGEYKRGKSTLINALLGSPILPMAVVPLTSVVTEVHPGNELGAAIEFLDGRRQEIALDELSDFVTEPANPRNQKGIRRAILRHPAAFLSEGVTIVDTPGVGSVFEHNTELAYEFLAESDAVVIVLGADQPLSADERRLMASLADITDRILVAVNRVDILSPDEAESSVRFIRESLLAMEEHPPALVFPISARRALDASLNAAAPPTDFSSFVRALHEVLVERKAEILVARARLLGCRAADLLILQLSAERQALSLVQDQIRGAIDQLNAVAEKIAVRLDDSVVLLKAQVDRVHEVELEKAANEMRGQLLSDLWSRVERSLSTDPRPVKDIAQELSATIGTWVVDALRPHYRRTEDLVHAGLSRALEEHEGRVHNAIGAVVHLANTLLGMKAEVPHAVAPLHERQRFYFRDWDYSGGQLRIPGWVLRLPRGWALPRGRGALRELLERRIDQNLQAIQSDWRMHLADAIRQFQRSSREQLSSVVDLITQVLQRARRISEDGATDQAANELARDLEDAERLRRQLRSPPVLNRQPQGRS